MTALTIREIVELQLNRLCFSSIHIREVLTSFLFFLFFFYYVDFSFQYYCMAISSYVVHRNIHVFACMTEIYVYPTIVIKNCYFVASKIYQYDKPALANKKNVILCAAIY